MWIVFAALILYNTAVLSGRFDAFRRWVLEHLPNDKRIVLIVIGYGFGSLLEGVSGFGAPVAITVLRATQGAEYVLSMKRGRIIPTTVTYERRGDVALIHLTGFNSATTDNLKAAIDKAKADLG